MSAPERSSPSAPSALGLAARHPLNVTLLAALGASAFLTGSVWPILVGLVAEAGWLAFGPRTEAVQDYADVLADRAEARAKLVDEQALVRQLKEEDRRRFLELDRVRHEIRDLVEGHDSLTLEMMRGELHKVDELLNAYLKVAAKTAAQERALADTDVAALQAEQASLQDGSTEEDRQVVAARLEQAQTLRQTVDSARTQLERVGDRLMLIRDQVVSMTRPEDLAEPLDDLVRTVKVVENTGRETEQLARRNFPQQTIQR